MLQLKNVSKQYNLDTVLQIPLLQLPNNIYWVKGANGSGKTTLLKIIAGLLPFKGDVVFDNISLKDKPLAYRQQVSWAEAEPLFPTFLTGKDLLGLYQNIRKVPQMEVDLLVDLFQIKSYVCNTIGTYSAGMTKKLSLVLAFIGNPSLIVLDEPLITLDADSYNRTCNYIFTKNKSSGTCFLMSSHQELNEQLSLSGKEIIVNNKSVSVM